MIGVFNNPYFFFCGRLSGSQVVMENENSVE